MKALDILKRNLTWQSVCVSMDDESLRDMQDLKEAIAELEEMNMKHEAQLKDAFYSSWANSGEGFNSEYGCSYDRLEEMWNEWKKDKE